MDDDGWSVVVKPAKFTPKKYRTPAYAEIKHEFDDEKVKKEVYTYCLSAKAHFDFSHFHALFKDSSLNWENKTLEEVSEATRVDFIFNDNNVPSTRKLFYTVTTGLKNDILAECVTNKAQLHALVAEHASYAIPETKVVDDDTKIVDGEVWVWRPTAGYAKSIRVVNSQKGLEELWQAHNSGKAYDKKLPDVLLSRYVEKPALWKGHKTTCRMFVLVTRIGEEQHVYMYEKGFLRVSEKPYEFSSFDDMKIHNCRFSRVATEGKDLFYPRDLSDNIDTDKATKQMHTILTDVFTHSLPKFTGYPETKNSYRILGADFMITEDNKVFLIEINGRPSMTLVEKTDDENIYGMLSEGVFYKAVEPNFTQQEPKDVKFLTKLI